MPTAGCACDSASVMFSAADTHVLRLSAGKTGAIPSAGLITVAMVLSFKLGSSHSAMALSAAFSGVFSTGHDRAMLYSGVETSLQAPPCAQLAVPAIMLVGVVSFLTGISKPEGRVSKPLPSSSS